MSHVESESDDEDNEELAKLRSAVSPELEKSLSQVSKKFPVKPEMQTKSIKRKECQVNKPFENTSQVQKHVLEKLSTYLDSIIEVEKPNHQFSSQPKQVEGGIKLFHNSSILLTGFEKQPEVLLRKRNLSLSGSDDGSNESKFREAVVSGFDILKGGEGAFQQKPAVQKKKKQKTAPPIEVDCGSRQLGNG